MMKRLIALLMAMLMLFAALPAMAEDAAGEEEEEALTQEELDELLKLDEVDENEVPEAVVGDVYQEMNREDFNKNSPAIYTCYLADPSSIFTQRSLESKRITYINSVNTKLDVLYVGSYWAIVRYNNNIGYIKRDRIHKVTPVDPVNTPPYGTQKSAYIATTAQACEVRKSMSDSDASWVVLKPGTKLSIWKI